MVKGLFGLVNTRENLPFLLESHVSGNLWAVSDSREMRERLLGRTNEGCGLIAAHVNQTVKKVARPAVLNTVDLGLIGLICLVSYVTLLQRVHMSISLTTKCGGEPR